MTFDDQKRLIAREASRPKPPEFAVNQTTKPNMTPENLAEICHEANRRYCRTLGDHSQPNWEMAPAWQKESAINGVCFHLKNPGAPPSRSHEEWLKEKRAQGWTYGPVKDPDNKQHPCFLPYEGLPLTQQAKDKLFIAVVDALRHLV